MFTHRREQRDKTKVRFKRGDESANPPTVAGRDHSKHAGSPRAQQASNCRASTTACRRVSPVREKVCCTTKFPVHIAGRATGTMKRKMNERGIPSARIETLREAPVTRIGSRHECMQHDDGRRFGTNGIKPDVRATVHRKRRHRIGRARPVDHRRAVGAEFECRLGECEFSARVCASQRARYFSTAAEETRPACRR